MTTRTDESDLRAMPEKAQCLSCGYLLRGLVVARCPECGTGFDPRDETTYLTEPMPTVLSILAILALVTVVLIDGMLMMLGWILMFTSVVTLFIERDGMVFFASLMGSCAIFGFGLMNFWAFGYRVERWDDPLCRLAVGVDVAVLLIPLALSVYLGGVFTFISMILILLTAGNILTLWLTKEH